MLRSISLSLSKIIALSKLVSRSTFGPADQDPIISLIGEIKENFRSVINRYLPDVSRIPLHQVLGKLSLHIDLLQGG